jgi:LAS superfamily LD-carboxypeptidase LdcB
MEERDHGSGPNFEGPAFTGPAFTGPASEPSFEPTPEPTPEDIGRAAAEAAALAGAPYDAPGAPGAPAPSRGPRRWLVTAGVAVAALALAGTAAAIATGSSHQGGSGDTTENAAAAHTAVTSAGSDTPTSGAAGSTSTSGSSTPDSTSSSSSSPTPSKPTTTSTTSKPSASKSSSPTPPAGTDEEGGDCENTSHSTPQDEAAKFSGMNSGAQHAFLAAQSAAKADGVSSFLLNSGYRSAAYQKRIFECWVEQLGSPQAARKYALPPNESAHVFGYAMDIAPPAAASWLENTKGQFGLCRRYADETWHFEYQASYKTKGCPALLPHP